MKIYVAGKFSLRGVAAVREAQAQCRARGHEITFDWTSHFDDVLARTDLSPAALAALETTAAVQDFDGAATCDVLVLIHHPELRGGLVEMGIALGSGAMVVVIGDERNIFCRLPQVERLDAIEELGGWLDFWANKVGT